MYKHVARLPCTYREVATILHNLEQRLVSTLLTSLHSITVTHFPFRHGRRSYNL